MPPPDEENIMRTVFVAWEGDSTTGAEHAYVHTQIKDYKTLPHSTYLCGLEVSGKNKPLNKQANTLEFMQSATGKKNPFSSLCEKCIKKLKEKGLL